MLRTVQQTRLQVFRCPPLPSRRALHSSPPTLFRPSSRTLLFGLKLPEPSNEPLAGTIAEVGVSGPPWLFLLQLVVGLPAALWAYKCLMLVLFQRKIIYLPSVPPGTRDESLAQGERSTARDASLSGMRWKEVQIQSTVPSRWMRRPVKLKGIELEWKEDEGKAVEGQRQHVVVVYLQGNAGTPLLRAPLFRALLRPSPSRKATSPSRSASSLPSSYHQSPPSPTPPPPPPPKVSLLALAPRSYWLSTRTTPTEAGVLADYRAALEYAYRIHGPEAKYVLYGHSLGGAAAVLLLEQLGQAPFPPLSSPAWSCAHPSPLSPPPHTTRPRVDALIVENPLPSIPIMVRALYPQKWLPYHYLGPFAFDKWDAAGRIERLSAWRGRGVGGEKRGGKGRGEEGGKGRKAVRTLWIRSGKDEIVPRGEEGEGGDPVRGMHADWLAAATSSSDSAHTPHSDSSSVFSPVDTDDKLARWVTIPDALHDTAFLERKWREEVRGFLKEVAREGRSGRG
ncbi:hypothetical protein JCM11251_002513 [Rhodosporidiobolus azoricus]